MSITVFYTFSLVAGFSEAPKVEIQQSSVMFYWVAVQVVLYEGTLMTFQLMLIEQSVLPLPSSALTNFKA